MLKNIFKIQKTTGKEKQRNKKQRGQAENK